MGLINSRYNNQVNRKSYIENGVPSNTVGRNGDTRICRLPKGVVLCIKVNNKWQELNVIKTINQNKEIMSVNELQIGNITLSIENGQLTVTGSNTKQVIGLHPIVSSMIF